jgi:DNA-binding PadR family transcriptional regulator
MHSHERFEPGPEWGKGRRGRRGGLWFAAPWGPPGDMPGPGGPGGPNQMWYGAPFGPGGGGPWGGRGGGGRGGRPWGRARRGDVRSAILALLAERPMHGYEIIGELSERTEGLWRPSPGSIYPTLQLLEDEGLIIAQADEAGGKRRYSLTDEGRRAAEEIAGGPAPWEAVTAGAPAGARNLRQAVMKLMPAVRQVMMTGGPREYEEVAKILDETRRRLYAILASEQAGPAPSGGAGATEGSADQPSPPQA